MIYNAIDTFYVTEQQLQESQHDIDEATQTSLRIYGCDLIQESGILLRLPQSAIATSQVLFHRFYCKKSFARFNVKRVAASCIWLASKLEECPRKARQVLVVFHRMECRRENLPIEHLDRFSNGYVDLREDLTRTERHILKEMGFVCHVDLPHKFISTYLAILETPETAPQLTQEALNLANDSLRTTMCVRFTSEVVACGIIYAAARRLQVPLPENPPWWEAFDATKEGIDEVCRVLAHLYSLPKAQYIPVCKDGGSFVVSKSNRSLQDLPSQSTVPKDSLQAETETATADTTAEEPSGPVNQEIGKDVKVKGERSNKKRKRERYREEERTKSTRDYDKHRHNSRERGHRSKNNQKNHDYARRSAGKTKHRSRHREHD